MLVGWSIMSTWSEIPALNAASVQVQGLRSSSTPCYCLQVPEPWKQSRESAYQEFRFGFSSFIPLATFSWWSPNSTNISMRRCPWTKALVQSSRPLLLYDREDCYLRRHIQPCFMCIQHPLSYVQVHQITTLPHKFLHRISFISKVI
jgi:hypothetical protein